MNVAVDGARPFCFLLQYCMFSVEYVSLVLELTVIVVSCFSSVGLDTFSKVKRNENRLCLIAWLHLLVDLPCIDVMCFLSDARVTNYHLFNSSDRKFMRKLDYLDFHDRRAIYK